MVAAYKGLCVILHASGKVRNVKPWEDLDSVYCGTATSLTRSFRDDEESTLAMSDAHSMSKSMASEKKSPMKRPRSFDTFGTANTYTEEAWVDRYAKKPVMKKIFENNTWVQEGSVRLIQDKIVRQSQVWGIILTMVVTAVFVALPKGNFY